MLQLSNRGDKYRFFQGTVIVSISSVFTVLFAFFLGQNYGVFVVNGQSMNPTLKNEQVILVKATEEPLELNRYDVIVFQIQDKWEALEQGSYIKRVFATHGDKVHTEPNIEGNDYTVIYNDTPTHITSSQAFDYVIGEDEVFVLGDNFNRSLDSRDVGPIPTDLIKYIAHKQKVTDEIKEAYQ